MTDARAFLASLADDRTALPAGFDCGAFALENLDLLGSTDACLRDELFYGTVNVWIQEGLMAPRGMAALLEAVCGREQLFRGIERPEGDEVFRRTFSLLLIASIVDRDNREPALGAARRAAALEALLAWAERERNTEGYLERGGWAHSVAHGADALGAFLAGPESATGQAARMLGAVEALLLRRPARYAHGEPRRLALAVGELLKRGGRAETLALVAGLAGRPELDRRGGMEAWYRRANALDFAQSLHFSVPRDFDPAFLSGLRDAVEALAARC